MKQKHKLSMLQDGRLHLVLYLLCSLGIFFVLEVYYIQPNIDKHLPWDLVIAVILSAFTIVFIAIFCLAFLFSKFNVVFSVTLPKVVEFSKAMQDIYIDDFNNQVHFITRKNVNIYISRSPLLQGTEENKSVKKYVVLQNKARITHYNGEKRLCLDYEDYEKLVQEQQQFSIPNYAEKMHKLEVERNSINAEKLILNDSIEELSKENLELKEQVKQLNKKLQTISARDGKEKKREKDKIVFYCVAYPTIQKLLDSATQDTKYTRSQIQEAFEQELENFPELETAIIALLKTKAKENENTPLALDGWAMTFMRDTLGEHAKTKET